MGSTAPWATWLLVPAMALVLYGVSAARRRLLVVTVAGTSMIPILQPGDRLLVLRHGAVHRGSVVVAMPPRPVGPVVKTVVAVPGDAVPDSVRGRVPDVTVPAGKLVLLGTHDTAADSRTWGFFALDDVVGIVVARLDRPSGYEPGT